MDVLVTGGTGFIGESLLRALLGAGHSVTVLSRTAPEGARGGIRYVRQLEQIGEGIDAIINLAGASLAGKRWTAAYKQEIVSSRLDTTRAIERWVSGLSTPPAVMLSASAIGYYGAHKDALLTEADPVGSGFSAALCQDWEGVAEQAAAAGGMRLCRLRLGVVLDGGGGAYAQMALPFRLGIANWVGEGSQWLSWIHRKDVIAAMLHLLSDEGCSGAFNLTAPEAVTSRGFCTAMRVQHRTMLAVPMPAPVMRLMVGEMADELLLSGQRVLPARLQEQGFAFSYPSIDSALAAITADS